MLFIYYSRCSTCQKAKKFIDNKNISYVERDIIKENPSKEELSRWIKKSGYELKKFFNSSGLKYRELNLKERLKFMNDDEKIDLLASDGMLVKRPLFISEDRILIGFKEEEWKGLE